MSILRIAHRYAKSLFDIAHEKNTLDAVSQDMKFLATLCDNKEFKLFLKSPLISIEKKQNVFKALVGDKVSADTIATLRVMVEHKREGYLNDICLEFEEMYLKAKHISKAKLVTAQAIDDALANKILAEFQAANLLDTQVALTREVNPSLMGGFVLYFNDQVYDASVAYKLGLLEKQFSENLYIKNF